MASSSRSSSSKPPPPSILDSLLALPATVARSPRLHLVLLRSLLLLLLLGAAAGLSSTAYFVLYFTWGRVPAFNGPLELTYGSPNHPPHASLALPATGHWRPGQPYDVFVELDCPLTKANVGLGNFMVGLDILPDGGGNVKNPAPLYSATRSALLTPPPVLSPAKLLPLVWGTPSRTVRLPLLGSVILDDGSKGRRAGRVTVWVGREDGWRGAGKSGGLGEVHTTGARLVIQGRLSGLRSLLTNHPLLSLTALTSASLLTTLLASLLTFYLYSPSLRLKPASTSSAAAARAKPIAAEPGGEARLRSSARERAWAATLPRSMDAITGDVSGSSESGSTASSLLGATAADEQAEEADLARLRAKEAEVRRIRLELEAAEEREADEAASRVPAERAAAVAAAGTREKAADDDERSLLGGSGTTPSHRTFGATTVSSLSSESTAPTSGGGLRSRSAGTSASQAL